MSTPLLEVSDLHSGYGAVRVLHGLDFSVAAGEVVVILGANGSGKTTTLRAVSGMLPRSGSVSWKGQSIANATPEALVRKGICHVPQGRGTLGDLTVEENLLVGAITRKDKSAIAADVRTWYDIFPRLHERRERPAAGLSGGEQQMLAIARALMGSPELLLLDEPSLGLAPLITQELFGRLSEINAQSGTAMLIVEQNADLALAIAQRGYVLEAGALVAQGTAKDLANDDRVRQAYLGA